MNQLEKIEAIRKEFGTFDAHTLYMNESGVMNPMEIYEWCDNLACRCNNEHHPRNTDRVETVTVNKMWRKDLGKWESQLPECWRYELFNQPTEQTTKRK